jgi:hypothetical protein
MGFIHILKAGTSEGAYKAWETIKAKYPEKFGKSPAPKPAGATPSTAALDKPAKSKSGDYPILIKDHFGAKLEKFEPFKEHYRSVYLPDDEATTVRAYTDIAYRTINRFLGKGGGAKAEVWLANIGGQALVDQAKKFIARLDSAISRGRLPFNVLLSRGMRAAPVLESLGVDDPKDLVGKVYTEKAFMSTTLVPRAEPGSMATSDPKKGFFVLRIRAPKGATALYLAAHNYSQYPEEHEVLLPRNSKLLIKNVSSERRTYIGKKKFYVVDAELLT